MPGDIQQEVRREAAALWEAVFGEPPPMEADGAMMLDIIVRHLEDKDYVRLYAAERARGIIWPRYDEASAPRLTSF